MHPQLLWNRQGERFTDVSASSGEYFNHRWLGRAVAVGDLDNDGAPDLIVTHLKDPPAVLRNDCARAGGSVRLELIGTRSARQPLGTRVTYRTGTQRLVTHVPSGGSFQASHDPRLLLAIGTGTGRTIPGLVAGGGRWRSFTMPLPMTRGYSAWSKGPATRQGNRLGTVPRRAAFRTGPESLPGHASRGSG